MASQILALLPTLTLITNFPHSGQSDLLKVQLDQDYLLLTIIQGHYSTLEMNSRLLFLASEVLCIVLHFNPKNFLSIFGHIKGIPNSRIPFLLFPQLSHGCHLLFFFNLVSTQTPFPQHYFPCLTLTLAP
jgi:hypothetical protein